MVHVHVQRAGNCSQPYHFIAGLCQSQRHEVPSACHQLHIRARALRGFSQVIQQNVRSRARGQRQPVELSRHELQLRALLGKVIDRFANLHHRLHHANSLVHASHQRCPACAGLLSGLLGLCPQLLGGLYSFYLRAFHLVERGKHLFCAFSFYCYNDFTDPWHASSLLPHSAGSLSTSRPCTLRRIPPAPAPAPRPALLPTLPPKTAHTLRTRPVVVGRTLAARTGTPLCVFCIVPD